ncbi:hypothetical protein COV18_05540 [Candidatus Woesearchaeota archaeon CG10_big_fil_rev_8_21_14_0_10_37_12]|nr:MAG: hypothetical protein COV18_05540 [Candidatus Woesearchaeota archaeon CG10_big_fil_rev_8_21_14_0_10_37_12]
MAGNQCSDENCVLFFMKHPTPGKVKTRLAEGYGGQKSAEVYACFLRDLSRMLRTVDAQTRVCYAPSDKEACVRKLLGNQHSYELAEGGDLGVILNSAFQNALRDHERVIVIGSDIPDLGKETIDGALDALREYDAVIGPTTDGGYYLLGFTREGFTSEAFRSITWSHDVVYSQTLNRLSDKRVFELEKRSDIDTLDDLRAFKARSNGSELESAVYVRNDKSLKID